MRTMRHDHRKDKPKRWSDARIHVDKNGCTIHSQREYIGYGFTSYYFVGTIVQIRAAQENVQIYYPKGGYGGTYGEPHELGDGLFFATGWHSESCE